MKMLADCGGRFYLPAKCGLIRSDSGAELQEYTIRLTGGFLLAPGGKMDNQKCTPLHTPGQFFHIIPVSV